MKYTPRRPVTNVNISSTHPLKEFAVLAGGLLVIVVVIYLALGLAVDLIVPRLSVDIEKQIGAVLTDVLAETDEITAATRPFQQIVDRLQEKCVQLPYPVFVHIQQADSINAAALPGGHMVVTTGLLERVASENELAFVLAHELGHFTHRDHLRGLGRMLVLITASTALLGADNSINGMIGQSVMLTELSFSRRQESRADEFALDTLYCRYGHVGEATAFFKKIPQDLDPGRFGHYFASHPENRRRIEHLQQLAEERGYAFDTPRPLPDGIGDPNDR